MSRAKRKKYWVGFDLGGTKMMAAVFDAQFRIVARRRRKTKATQGASAGVQRIAETIEDALGDAGVKQSEVAGIGVGSPGPLDLNRGIILETPNLGWKNVHLARLLRKHFNCPVILINDVDAGVYGEYRFGAGRKARCVVGVFPGTGIGGGCVYEGRIIRGRSLSCFEIGHIVVQPEGPLCGCGRYGCLEAVASRLAVASAAAEAAFRGQAPHLLEIVGTDISKMKSTDLADAIKAGDKAVEKIVRRAARWLGVGIGTVINLMAPDMIVLGGGLVEAMPEIYLEEVPRSANQHVMPSFRNTFKVAVARLGDDACAAGAAAWASEMFTENAE
ncbi:MAG: ROK family protein [Kiritimatiellae bacterium]|nr:ROK family protein [Kiritimatiellia bacterium]